MKKVLHIVLVAGLAMAMLAAKPGPREYANAGATYLNAGNTVHASFTAQTRGAPSDAKGQVEVHVENADGDLVQRFHGVVTCLVVAGDTATIEGDVTQLDLGTNTNEDRTFRLTVQDNGEGEDAPADRAHHQRTTDFGECEGSSPARNDVIGGNIQVG